MLGDPGFKARFVFVSSCADEFGSYAIDEMPDDGGEFFFDGDVFVGEGPDGVGGEFVASGDSFLVAEHVAVEQFGEGADCLWFDAFAEVVEVVAQVSGGVLPADGEGGSCHAWGESEQDPGRLAVAVVVEVGEEPAEDGVERVDPADGVAWVDRSGDDVA